MKQYCVDTSGFSTPLERMPDDIYGALWLRVIEVIERGAIAVTPEIYGEMEGSLRGLIGNCIDRNKQTMVLDLDTPGWDPAAY